MTARFHHAGFDLQFDDSDVLNVSDYTAGIGYNGTHDGRTRPFFLHDQGFCLAVVFAESLQDAIDEAVDAGKLDRYKIDAEELAEYAALESDEARDEYEEEYQWSFLGNAGEAFQIESLDVIELPVVPFSFAALTVAHENDLQYEAWHVDARKTARLERDLRFRDDMIERARAALEKGHIQTADACLDRALNYKWEEAPVTSAVESRYERAWKEAEYHAACLNKPIHVEIKGEGEETS